MECGILYRMVAEQIGLRATLATHRMDHGGVQVLCCEWFLLCRYNLGGDEKGGGGGKFFGI